VLVDAEAHMGLALDEARAALEHGDVPVGAVVVLQEDDGTARVVARRHNERELLHDPTAHAELLALRDASSVLGRWRLSDCTLVATLEPCAMCAGAALHARVGGVVFGAFDLKAGALSSRYHLLADPRLNHQAEVVGGVRAGECAALLDDFFAARR